MLSYWEQTSFFAPADYAIIGAGFLGLFTAIELQKKYPAKRIVVVEKANIPFGASTRNAGFACFGSATELLYDAEKNGVEAMLQTVEYRCKGIEKIKQLFGVAAIDYDACCGYECISNTLHYSSILHEQIQQLNKQVQPIFNTPHTFKQATRKLSTLGLQNFDDLYENELEGGLHSGKLMQQLIQLASAKGIQILWNTEVKKIANLSNVIEVQLPTTTLLSEQIIVCTNAFTNTLLPQENITPARGQIFVTKPIDNLKMKGTFHFNEGFYYWRNIGNRVLLGGARNTNIESEQTTEMATTTTIQQKLVQFAQQHFVNFSTESIEYSWSGIMAFTENKMPLIKQVHPQITVAIGCNGIGVALTPVLAEKIAATV
jgi:gamma-glutamylputrescine oxidase